MLANPVVTLQPETQYLFFCMKSSFHCLGSSHALHSMPKSLAPQNTHGTPNKMRDKVCRINFMQDLRL